MWCFTTGASPQNAQLAIFRSGLFHISIHKTRHCFKELQLPYSDWRNISMYAYRFREYPRRSLKWIKSRKRYKISKKFLSVGQSTRNGRVHWKENHFQTSQWKSRPCTLLWTKFPLFSRKLQFNLPSSRGYWPSSWCSSRLVFRITVRNVFSLSVL